MTSVKVLCTSLPVGRSTVNNSHDLSCIKQPNTEDLSKTLKGWGSLKKKKKIILEQEEKWEVPGKRTGLNWTISGYWFAYFPHNI